MEELTIQIDGCYALCFKNYKKVSLEEVEKIFTRYGDVFSIRQSSEAIPWVFIRYKVKEEAQKALDDLQDYKDFDVRVAKSNAKKKQDQDGDREKSDSFSEGSRENRSMKGVQNRNRGLERFTMDSEDNGSFDTKGSPKKAPYNMKRSNFVERHNKNKEEDDYNYSDRGDEVENARASFTKMEMATPKNQKSPNGKYSRGREDSENCRRSFNSSPPRLVKKSPGNHSVNGAVENRRQLDDGPPKLVKGSDYYSFMTQSNSTRGLALKAAYEEVWANHPLRSEMQLREVIMTNFENVPSKKDIYNLCSPIKPLHVSFGRTVQQSVFCRVLVATDGDVEHLCNLRSGDVYVTTVEELLDTLFEEEV